MLKGLADTDGERVREMRRLLKLAAFYRDPNEDRSHITGLKHALRVGGQLEQYSDEYAFVGLVHDLARPLSDVFHGEVMAEMVRDRVSAVSYMVLRDHGQFQDAIVHDRRYEDWPKSPPELMPSQANEFQLMSGMLAGAEVASFLATYSGPTMKLSRANELIRQYLGAQ